NRLIQLAALQQELLKDQSANDLLVPEKLTSPDPLIVSAKNNLVVNKDNRRHKDEVIRLAPLDVHVAHKNVSRSLRFMDTLIKALKNRSHDIKCENSGMYVVIGDEKIQISLKEKVKRNVK